MYSIMKPRWRMQAHLIPGDRFHRIACELWVTCKNSTCSESPQVQCCYQPHVSSNLQRLPECRTRLAATPSPAP